MGEETPPWTAECKALLMLKVVRNDRTVAEAGGAYDIASLAIEA